jgi:hypothetical protein
VNVTEAPAATDGLVKLHEPTRPLHTTGPLAAPDAVVTTAENPLPAALETKLPLVAVISPRVAVNVVVAVTEPGAVRAAGSDHVIVLPEPVVVIWFAVPARVMLPALGAIAPPEPPVRVATVPVERPICSHVTLPAGPVFATHIYSVDVAVLTYIVPIGLSVLFVEGATCAMIQLQGFGTHPPPKNGTTLFPPTPELNGICPRKFFVLTASYNVLAFLYYDINWMLEITGYLTYK